MLDSTMGESRRLNSDLTPILQRFAPGQIPGVVVDVYLDPMISAIDDRDHHSQEDCAADNIHDDLAH